jgi:uncharacterized protein YndB with AHSA1/START domain
MICKLESEHPVTDAACKDATGRTLAQWYSVLDSRGALKDGRRNTVMFLMGEKVGDWWATTIAVEHEKQAGPPKKDGLYEGYGICSTKTIAAPLDKTFAAWMGSAALSKWFGAGTKAKVEDGGSYSNADGNAGKYLRVRADKDLRFSWEDPAFSSASLVDVAFSDKGGKTGLVVNHTRIQTRPEADGLRAAWSEALSNLKALLEC